MDSVGGLDTNNGTSTSTPWQTLAKVNSTTLAAGDTVSLKRGGTFTALGIGGTGNNGVTYVLTCTGTGSTGLPITYNDYGTGNKPIIDAGTISRTNGILCGGFSSNKAFRSFQNIVVQGASSDGINIVSSTTTFNGVESSTNGGNGLSIVTNTSAGLTPTDITVTNSKFDGNTASGIAAANPYRGVYSHGLHFDTIEANNNSQSGLKINAFATILSLTASTTPNIYEASVGTPTNGVFINGALGTSVGSVGQLISAGQYYFDSVGARLYVYATSLPSNPGVEVPAKVSDVRITNSTFQNNGGTSSAYYGIDVESRALYINNADIVPSNFSDGLYINNVVVSGNSGGGIYESGFSSNVLPSAISGSSIYNNGAYGAAGGIYASGNTGLVIEKNIVHDNAAANLSSSGVGINLSAYNNGVIVRYNSVYNQSGNVSQVNSGHGIYVYTSKNTQVYGNVIHDNRDGIRIDDLVTADVNKNATGNVVYGNTVANNSRIQIALWSYTPSVSVRNNIVYGGQYGIFMDNFDSTYVIDEDFNCIGNSSLADFLAFTPGSHTKVNCHPYFANLAGNDFSLLANSQAINAGTNLGSTYQSALTNATVWPGDTITTANQNSYGSGWEMGAYLFNPVTAPSTLGTYSSFPLESDMGITNDSAITNVYGSNGYPNASATVPFATPASPTAYQVFDVYAHDGTMYTDTNPASISRGFDFSGAIPFTTAGHANPATFQFWDTMAGAMAQLNGDNVIDGATTTAKGLGRIDKFASGGTTYTRLRNVIGDGAVAGKCRAQLNTYAVPTRTRQRWELEAAFGGVDSENTWNGPSTPGVSPVLFWQIKSGNTGPSMSAVVDTDSQDPNLLQLSFVSYDNQTTAPATTTIALVHGIPKNTLVPIVIDTFLDDRSMASGGQGRTRVWVNGTLVGDKIGQNTPAQHVSSDHYLQGAITAYNFNDVTCQYNRAILFKTAKMFVYPSGFRNAAINVDTSVSSSAITARATFNTPITVDASNGTPRILLAGGSRYADYVSGSGTDTLTFTYGVQSSDRPHEINYAQVTGLNLQGAIIKDSELNSISTDLSVAPIMHIVGELIANSYFSFKLDGSATTTAITNNGQCKSGICLVDSSGNLSFTYQGGYSTHTFDFQKTFASLSSSNTIAGQQATVSWPAAWGIVDLTKYRLYIDNVLSVDNIASTTTSTTVPSSASSCNTSYGWYVQAVDNAGNGANSDIQHFSIPCGAISFFSPPIIPTVVPTPAPTSNPSGLSETQVQSIISLLNSFGLDQAAIDSVTNALRGAPSLAPSAPVATTSFTRNLSLNQTGADVKALQQYLNTHGFIVSSTGAGSPGHETTTFGLATYKALVKFQKAHSITPASGWFGPMTRAKVD